jgi:hypothetical protein
MELSIGAVHDRVGDRGPAAKYEAGPLDDILYPGGRPQNVQDDAHEWCSDVSSDQQQQRENKDNLDADPRTSPKQAGENECATPMESTRNARANPGMPAQSSRGAHGHRTSVDASGDAQGADTAPSPARKRPSAWFTGQATPGVKLCRTEAMYGNSNREKLEIYSNK